jgi:hypothetical protein
LENKLLYLILTVQEGKTKEWGSKNYEKIKEMEEEGDKR